MSYLFVAAFVIALFGFLSTAHWVTTRAQERKARERYTLLRKIAEQPVESAQLVLALLREDDAKEEAARERAAKRSRTDSMQGGWILIAAGAGLSIFLSAVAPDKAVWTVGIMLGLIGIVMLVFAIFSKPE